MTNGNGGVLVRRRTLSTPIDHGRFDEGAGVTYWHLEPALGREARRVYPDDEYDWAEPVLADSRLVDGAGNRRSFDGEPFEGPHEGRQLERRNSHGIFRFAWSEFHPAMEVYSGSEG